VIRRATLDDLAELMVLVREFDPTTLESGVVPLLSENAYGLIWVTGELDAYAVVTWSWSLESGGLEAIVDEIYVRHRGEGTGSALIEHLLGDCDRRGVRRVFLESEADNAAARRLYTRFGFVAETSIWMARVNGV
jgi:GNAT superfamily N-acetyltransferase